MERLTDDLIKEILVKLPVKSLLRFRCVCKSWFHLINSPNFIERHLKNHKNNDSILVIRSLKDMEKHFLSLHSYESLSVISPLFQVPFESIFVKVCGSCNGLLCLSLEDIVIICNPALRKLKVSIVLCNPAMREFKMLPPRPFSCPEGWEYRVMAIGFGFDSNANDYKVITIVNLSQSFGNNRVYKAEIYDLSTNSWREIDHGHDLPFIDFTPGFGTLFNGAFHWVASGENSDYILSFDMSTELFREMELPNIDPLEGKRKSLIVLNESLALFVYTDPRICDPADEQFVDVWVMLQYGMAESWTKLFIVGPVFGIIWPFLLWKNEAILLESHEGRLVSCALDTHEMNDFEIHGVPDTFNVMAYQESLVSMN